jgi:hypothetical protein
MIDVIVNREIAQRRDVSSHLPANMSTAIYTVDEFFAAVFIAFS